MSQALEGATRASAAMREEVEQNMSQKTRSALEPDWLNPANVRKASHTDAELDARAADFIAMNRDVAVWRNLIATVGEQEATAVAKQCLASRDPLSLIGWKPVGAVH